MTPILLQPPRIDQVPLNLKFRTSAAVLRLDEVHPVVSGNKWYKLRYYLEAAQQQNKRILLSFGGPWSNHIVATAAAARACGFHSIGIIRGEEPRTWSQTLLDARQLGMELFFLSRNDYRQKKLPAGLVTGEVLVIPEGGNGAEGVAGAASILAQTDHARYTHILAAAGTGTTLAGLARTALPAQEVLGVPVLKGTGPMADEIRLAAERPISWMDGYHFGGYAKKSDTLIRFMNAWYEQTGIPSDFVYTGKLFYAFNDLLENGFFPPGSEVLIVHTGGLQGNRSLPNGTLIF